jgi:hypothetical protein
MEYAEFSRENLVKDRKIERDNADTVFPFNNDGLIFHIIPPIKAA